MGNISTQFEKKQCGLKSMQLTMKIKHTNSHSSRRRSGTISHTITKNHLSEMDPVLQRGERSLEKKLKMRIPYPPFSFGRT